MLALLVTGVILTVGCAGTEVSTPTQEAPARIIKDITVQEAATLIQQNQNNPDFTIIDVRTKEEAAAGHIEGAANLDFYQPTFRDDLNRLDKNKTYLVYCRSGSRSRSAVDMMKELNFKEVYNMLGGIVGWQTEGLPTVK